MERTKHFTHYWEKAKKHGLTRGAYHFYRPDEDPVTQADSYIRSVNLSSGDMRPVLDVEKLPKNQIQRTIHKRPSYLDRYNRKTLWQKTYSLHILPFL